MTGKVNHENDDEYDGLGDDGADGEHEDDDKWRTGGGARRAGRGWVSSHWTWQAPTQRAVLPQSQNISNRI